MPSDTEALGGIQIRESQKMGIYMAHETVYWMAQSNDGRQRVGRLLFQQQRKHVKRTQYGTDSSRVLAERIGLSGIAAVNEMSKVGGLA